MPSKGRKSLHAGHLADLRIASVVLSAVGRPPGLPSVFVRRSLRCMAVVDGRFHRDGHALSAPAALACGHRRRTLLRRPSLVREMPPAPLALGQLRPRHALLPSSDGPIALRRMEPRCRPACRGHLLVPGLGFVGHGTRSCCLFVQTHGGIRGRFVQIRAGSTWVDSSRDLFFVAGMLPDVHQEHPGCRTLADGAVPCRCPAIGRIPDVCRFGNGIRFVRLALRHGPLFAKSRHATRPLPRYNKRLDIAWGVYGLDGKHQTQWCFCRFRVLGSVRTSHMPTGSKALGILGGTFRVPVRDHCVFLACHFMESHRDFLEGLRPSAISFHDIRSGRISETGFHMGLACRQR